MTGETRSQKGGPGRRLALAVLVLAAAGAGGWFWLHPPGGGVASKPATPQERVVSVVAGKAVRKSAPVRAEALGTVESMVTVPIRSRVAATVEKVLFADGAQVNLGDLLFVLDSRVVDADIRQAEATLSRDKAQLEKAERDVERYAGLATRAAVSQVQLDDARTTSAVQKATVAQDEANLQSLKVQRGYYEVRAPVTGRIGVSAVRVGAVIGANDTLATVRQLKPIYIAFGLPERYLGELRAAQNAMVSFTLQGSRDRIEGGRVQVLDNTIDPQTGTIAVRAVFENADERLWPGTLGAVTLTLRTEDNVVAVPSEAVQAGQAGQFVFILQKDGDREIAKVRPVKVARTVDGESIIASGLDGGETVVLDGQLSLRDGTRVRIRPAGPAVAGS